MMRGWLMSSTVATPEMMRKGRLWAGAHPSPHRIVITQKESVRVKLSNRRRKLAMPSDWVKTLYVVGRKKALMLSGEEAMSPALSDLEGSRGLMCACIRAFWMTYPALDSADTRRAIVFSATTSGGTSSSILSAAALASTTTGTLLPSTAPPPATRTPITYVPLVPCVIKKSLKVASARTPGSRTLGASTTAPVTFRGGVSQLPPPSE
mmetsp:Transcript_1813/g.4350  ORF Transcript_1813/g.4350 Transcript_1813/m.4350 type:complete len:208 (-) Transcript_1813:28-651(-)